MLYIMSPQEKTHGVKRHVEGDLDVRLGRKVVDLRRLYLRDDVDEVRRVDHVTVMEDHIRFCSKPSTKLPKERVYVSSTHSRGHPCIDARS
jgi:hypothetical protein